MSLVTFDLNYISFYAITSLVEGQNLDLSRFGVKQYLVREVQGKIWIYMPTTDKADAREPDMDIPLVPYFDDQSYQLVDTTQP